MGMVCAVSFERYGRLYYFDPGPYSPTIGDKVLVPTDDGPEVAECVWAPQWASEDTMGMPVLAGMAAQADLDRDSLSRKRKAAARVAAKRLVREHKLPMNVVGVDPDGEGPGPAADPAAHLGRVRPAAVLPEVRAPAVRQGARDRALARLRGRDARGPGPRGRGQRA